MGFLTPLYFAGLLAVSLPLVFHLIRRTPRGEVLFSSLMFLTPSPPRITRRSRLDQLLLLLLRGLALVLLALAFARPFLRQSVNQVAEDAPQEHIAVLLDASASMQREDLWQQAVAAADEVLAAAGPLDRVGVYTFDEALRPVASLDELSEVPPAQRRALVADRLQDVAPGYGSTRIGRAIADALDEAGDATDATAQTGRAARRIVLISDMQTGGRIDALGEYVWPEDARLQLQSVTTRETSNAGLQRLADDSVVEAASHRHSPKLRVRVANAADSQADQYRLQWLDASDQPIASPVDAYVPPGESRVVRIAPPEEGSAAVKLALQGDAHPFDNAMYFVPKTKQRVTIAYCGVDRPDDPQENQYYLESALSSDPSRTVEVNAFAPGDALPLDLDDPPLLFVATAPPTAAQCAKLHDFLERGGAMLYALGEGDEGVALASLAGVDQVDVEEADVAGYAMLRDIDFSHAMFAAMSGPQFNDFTQIRFWKYRVLNEENFPDARIVARFEEGHPALIEHRVGDGRLIVLASSWKPSDSQLARSWKFLLMISALVDDLRPDRDFGQDFVVGRPAPLPDGVQLAEEPSVTKPNGTVVALAADAQSFADADQPGIYEVAAIDGPLRFAVNLDPAETETAPLASEAFAQLGCRLMGSAGAATDSKLIKQLRDLELERQQRIWKWLIVVVLAVLLAETWLAGSISRRTALELATGTAH